MGFLGVTIGSPYAKKQQKQNIKKQQETNQFFVDQAKANLPRLTATAEQNLQQQGQLGGFFSGQSQTQLPRMTASTEQNLQQQGELGNLFAGQAQQYVPFYGQRMNYLSDRLLDRATSSVPGTPGFIQGMYNRNRGDILDAGRYGRGNLQVGLRQGGMLNSGQANSLLGAQNLATMRALNENALSIDELEYNRQVDEQRYRDSVMASLRAAEAQSLGQYTGMGGQAADIYGNVAGQYAGLGGMYAGLGGQAANIYGNIAGQYANLGGMYAGMGGQGAAGMGQAAQQWGQVAAEADPLNKLSQFASGVGSYLGYRGGNQQPATHTPYPYGTGYGTGIGGGFQTMNVSSEPNVFFTGTPPLKQYVRR